MIRRVLPFLVLSFWQIGVCAHPGEQTSGLVSTIPQAAPSGSVAVKTLLLTNLSRMQTVMGISTAEADALAIHIQELANHPRVEGQVVDLGLVPSLTALYAVWDADPADPGKANDVVFAPGGLHETILQELLPTYGGVEYLVLVGDDRIIPMARIHDLTDYPEGNYTDPAAGDLTAGGTTVGQALAQDRYLSDDLLAVTSSVTLPLTPAVVARGGFLPELAIGRLVENPDEIINTIDTFLSWDGVIDLGALDPDTGHKVLVTGYDFLIDSGKQNRRRWKEALGAALPENPDDLAPVDGRLLSPTWDVPTVDERRALLREHLAGNGGSRYAINNLNGHATHFEEGVPGTSLTDVQGLSAAEIYGPHACGSDPGIDLAGAVVYGAGCHGGLPVAGSCIDDTDHSLDLPQTMMARGVLAYVANTGYGWGLTHGLGLSEQLVRILTGEMTAGGTISVGDAMVRSKLRYFLEVPHFDVYDEKTLLQWTLFGLPMVAVQTGIAAKADSSWLGNGLLDSGGPEREQFGAAAVERHAVEAARSLPPFLTQLDVHFDFSDAGVYTKYNALGDVVDDASPGCPHPDGCYYTLVERATGTPDLPIQPYLIYESRLSGTSHHGVLWMGGAYDQEEGWIPVIAERVSNGGAFSNDGPLQRIILDRPRLRWRDPGGGEDPSCQPSDLELNTLLLTTGEAVKNQESDPVYDVERLYREIDVEILYFNNPVDGAGNCDREGPELLPSPFGDDYHQLVGRRVEWAVPVSDEGGVWRVVVVWDDETEQTWRPIELEDDGTGTWRAELLVGPEAPRLTYVLQAVDRRGNVTWLEYVPNEPPPCCVPPDLPAVVDVAIPPGSADLSMLKEGEINFTGGVRVSYQLTVRNNGPVDVFGATVVDGFPAELMGVAWSCAATTGSSCTASGTGDVTDTVDVLAGGTLNYLVEAVVVPSFAGVIENTATVHVPDGVDDSDPTNNASSVVLDSDLDGVIFADGFESGNVSAWSSSTEQP